MTETPSRPLAEMMLSAIAGYVDAVGFLLLGGLFVALMSGNTTRLGLDVVRGAAVAGWVAVIVAFVLGASAGALLRNAAGPRPALLGLPVLAEMLRLARTREHAAKGP